MALVVLVIDGVLSFNAFGLDDNLILNDNLVLDDNLAFVGLMSVKLGGGKLGSGGFLLSKNKLLCGKIQKVMQ